MKIGFIGLGKLGMPCAVAMDYCGHDVMGYDIIEANMSKEPRIYQETGPQGHGEFNGWLKASTIRFGTLREVAAHSEIIFLAIQTPHDPMFEGTTRVPSTRKDFDYTYLKVAVESLAEVVYHDTIIVVISTVLPGTMEKHIIPLLNKHMRLCYNPFFIAMGNTMRDFLNPEFVLLGVDDEWAANTTQKFWEDMYRNNDPPVPIRRMSIPSAELCKVAYNTYISSKIAVANTLMEICHKTPGANIDDVNSALKLAYRRITSSAYMDAGMGDGGSCHPRDNIAMSWLARKLNLSYDWFENAMIARENQAEWLCGLVSRAYDNMHKIYSEESILILGTSFKPESNIEVGSSALLCKNLLEEMGYTVNTYDPFVDTDRIFDWPLGGKTAEIVLIGTRHEIFKSWCFPEGSVVIDPFRYLHDQDGVTIIRVGE
jgi:UDPglucose 6-dehydrogenase